MRYAIIDAIKGEVAGMTPQAHILLSGGKRMIVNENELRKVSEDVSQAAAELGGRLMSYGEVMNEKNKDNG